MRDRFGSVQGLKVVITGDVVHSRVARSTGVCLRALGAEVTLVGPEGLAQAERLASLGLPVSHDLDGALRGADVAYMLRIQLERHGREGTAGVPPIDEYRTAYQLDMRRLGLLSERGVVMHPGPVNRGVELSPDLADHRPSVILDQVRNGVAIRMAVLYHFAGRRRRPGLAAEAPRGGAAA
jgi:aspartate carbamoyltransferase catalytic subunit